MIMLLPRCRSYLVLARRAGHAPIANIIKLLILGTIGVLFVKYLRSYSGSPTISIILRSIITDIWLVPGSMACSQINFANISTKQFHVEWDRQFNTPDILNWRQDYLKQCPYRRKTLSTALASNRPFSPGYGLGVSINFALSLFLLSSTSFPPRNFHLYIVDWNYVSWEGIFEDFTLDSPCQIVRTMNDSTFSTVIRDADNLISPNIKEDTVDFGPSRDLLLEIMNGNGWNRFFRVQIPRLENVLGKEEFFRRKSTIARGLMQLQPEMMSVVEAIWTQLTDGGNYGYSVVHIRRSDKTNTGEAEAFPIILYYRGLRRLCHSHPAKKCSRKVYVFCDDPAVCNEFKFLTSNCFQVSDFRQHVEQGKISPWYNKTSVIFKSQKQFNALPREDRLANAKELFVSIFIAALSDFVVCTYSSNICLLIALLRNGQLNHSDILSLDLLEWFDN